MGLFKFTGIYTGAEAMTDNEVVQRVRQEETALFEILMRHYNARL